MNIYIALSLLFIIINHISNKGETELRLWIELFCSLSYIFLNNVPQIIHTNGNHWLAITNLGTTSTIKLLDSLALDLDYEALKGIASKSFFTPSSELI